MSSIHANPSPLAGTIVKAVVNGHPRDVSIVDWFDRVAGQSWMRAGDEGNAFALDYASRISKGPGLPVDNEVFLVKVGGVRHVIHASEIVRDDVNAVAAQGVAL